MAPTRLVIPGSSKGGVAVPQHEMSFARRYQRRIHVKPADMTPELEFHWTNGQG